MCIYINGRKCNASSVCRQHISLCIPKLYIMISFSQDFNSGLNADGQMPIGAEDAVAYLRWSRPTPCTTAVLAVQTTRLERSRPAWNDGSYVRAQDN